MPLSRAKKIVGFFSYAREDDNNSDGKLSELRDVIRRELSDRLGLPESKFQLFQDREAIPYGTLWETKIQQAISEFVFFIPIITPRALNSSYCAAEFDLFLQREEELGGRDDLVFPILYVRVPELESEKERKRDSALQLVAKRQYFNYIPHRYKNINATEVAQDIGHFCEKIYDALIKLTPQEEREEIAETEWETIGGTNDVQLLKSFAFRFDDLPIGGLARARADQLGLTLAAGTQSIDSANEGQDGKAIVRPTSADTPYLTMPSPRWASQTEQYAPPGEETSSLNVDDYLSREKMVEPLPSLDAGKSADLGGFLPEENGTISVYNPDRRFGFISVSGKSKLHFFQRALPTNAPRDLVGSTVLAQVTRDRRGITASSVRILGRSPETSVAQQGSASTFDAELKSLAKTVHRSQLLTKWSNLRVFPRKGASTKDGTDMPELASQALPEAWCFKGERDQYSILRGYINNTFYRVVQESKVAISTTHAAFNTGLVDRNIDPIYAFFARNMRLGSRPYRFVGFCTAGDGASGKELIAQFSTQDLPNPAMYIKSLDDVFFEPSGSITFDFDHIIDDAIERGRYPPLFLQRHLPHSMRDKGEPLFHERAWLKQYVESLNDDVVRKRALTNDLRYAVEIAQKRAKWNYKTAVVGYFPRQNATAILLPLALVDYATPDMALVVSRVSSGDYFGLTVYRLDAAYGFARLVCKPDSDWLIGDGSNDRSHEGAR